MYRWDALLFGDIRPVKPPAPPDKFHVQHSFHLRPPIISHYQRHEVQNLFKNAARNIRLYLGHGALDPHTSRLDKLDRQCCGLTFRSWNYTPRELKNRYPHVYIMIDFREFQGLLRGGLNVCICTRGAMT